MKGVFIPEITIEMLRGASLETIEDFFSSILEGDGGVTMWDAELPRWIPCSERLPEKKGFYLVTTEERKTATMGFYEDIWFKTEKVTAWMPLPKPWEGGQNADPIYN